MLTLSVLSTATPRLTEEEDDEQEDNSVHIQRNGYSAAARGNGGRKELPGGS